MAAARSLSAFVGAALAASCAGLLQPRASIRMDSSDAPSPTQRGTVNPLRLAVLKMGATELAFTSPLNWEKRDGDFICAGCGAKLFDSTAKYDSGSGWPSFWRTAGNSAIEHRREWDGRVEVRCASCQGHLGHVFQDGPAATPSTDVPDSDIKYKNGRLPRYCINGASLFFEPYDGSTKPE
mmetsp:Transcript_1238/g.3469  ORF Transcript_1238/g.3469 Transcript_1238/m.3469 type:complete len:181 (-) Transcript_1238:55-597(-)